MPSKNRLVIEMLPAREGDCLLLSYTSNNTTRHILIDGGRKATYDAVKKRLAELPANERTLELLVVTHVDRDHIEGVIAMLEDAECPVRFRDIWFNGYAHLLDPDAIEEDFGGVLGERLTTYLSKKGPWNVDFDRRAVHVARTPTRKRLAGGMNLTVLSPDATQLKALAKTWAQECIAANLDPMNPLDTKRTRSGKRGVEDYGLEIRKLASDECELDTAPANGSSIGLLAAFKEKNVLLAADCHPDRLVRSLQLLRKKHNGKRLPLAAFKLPHHGSERNLPRDLLECIQCRRYLVSTSGAYFKHPTRSAIARVLLHGGRSKELYFNYSSRYTRIWDSDSLRSEFDYKTYYPEKRKNGWLVVPIDLS